jgi:hypothetical protein
MVAATAIDFLPRPLWFLSTELPDHLCPIFSQAQPSLVMTWAAIILKWADMCVLRLCTVGRDGLTSTLKCYFYPKKPHFSSKHRVTGGHFMLPKVRWQKLWPVSRSELEAKLKEQVPVPRSTATQHFGQPRWFLSHSFLDHSSQFLLLYFPLLEWQEREQERNFKKVKNE